MRLLKQKKYHISVFLVFTLFAALLLPTTLLAAEVQADRNITILYEDAILYTINGEDELELNVVHKAYNASKAEIVDNTGSGINTVGLLKEAMGTLDVPEAIHGTDVGERTLGKAVTANVELDKNRNVVKVTITDVRERPVVGISWKSNTVGSDYKGFAEAFERNGAFALYLPQVLDAEGARDVLSKLNGIFMTGGSDWNPALYDEEQTPHGSSGWNDPRDTSDLNLMQQAVVMDVPMLAVCRGEQGFNIAMGGGLIQDVPYYLGLQVLAGKIDASRVTGVLDDNGYSKWNSDTQSFVRTTSADCGDHYRVQIDGLIHSGGTAYHRIDDGENIGIDPNSKWLYKILGTTSMEFVATAHHQSVNPEKLGEGLTIVAYSSDGIVEAIEHQDSLFALGIQWHPERDALRDSRGVGLDLDECNALLGALVEYAGTHADIQSGSNTPDGGSGGSSSNCNAGMTPAMIACLALLSAGAFKLRRK